MTLLNDIANVVTSIADGDLLYIAEDLTGSYQDGQATALVFKNYVLTGPLAVIGSSAAGAQIRLPEDTDNGSNYVALKAPDALAGTITFTLPSADGTDGQAIVTNASGVLSFATVSAAAPLTLAGGTVTDPSAPLTITQTWNDAADAFVGLDVAITNTASAVATSRVMRATVGANTVFGVKTDGSFGSFSYGMSYDMFGGGAGVGDIKLGNVTIGRYNDGGDTTGHSMVYNWGVALSSTGSTNSNYSDVKLHASAVGILNLRADSKTVGAALNLLEQTAPSAPSTNQVVIYAEDNGSGKTRLMARFATGAAQQLAIEP
jgi:hypothetical protein